MHGWGHSQLRMRADEIVEQGLERNHLNVVRELLAVAVRQAREATHVHPHRLVVRLHERRGDVIDVRVAFDAALEGSDALSRAVAALEGVRDVAIQLDQVGIVLVGPKRALDCFQMGAAAIRCQLDQSRLSTGTITVRRTASNCAGVRCCWSTARISSAHLASSLRLK